MEAPIIERGYVNYTQATRYTGLSRTTIWRAHRAGQLRASGSGRGIRFRVQDLDLFMASRGEDPTDR